MKYHLNVLPLNYASITQSPELEYTAIPNALELLLQARGLLLLLFLQRGQQGPELGTPGLHLRLGGGLTGQYHTFKNRY